ncbi:unnamed protein product [Parajaminaea phylloscopi]
MPQHGACCNLEWPLCVQWTKPFTRHKPADVRVPRPLRSGTYGSPDGASRELQWPVWSSSPEPSSARATWTRLTEPAQGPARTPASPGQHLLSLPDMRAEL